MVEQVCFAEFETNLTVHLEIKSSLGDFTHMSPMPSPLLSVLTVFMSSSIASKAVKPSTKPLISDTGRLHLGNIIIDEADNLQKFTCSSPVLTVLAKLTSSGCKHCADTVPTLARVCPFALSNLAA